MKAITRVLQPHKAPAGPRQVLQRAQRAQELNTGLYALWRASAGFSQQDFQETLTPAYFTLLSVLTAQTNRADAETTVLELLERTTNACHRRAHKRLPMRRPGADYRKYQTPYTYALITAMAAESLLRHPQTPIDTPEAAIDTLLSGAALARLKKDPMVWEDWLGYFSQSPIGGLYEIATEDRGGGRPSASNNLPGHKRPITSPATPYNPRVATFDTPQARPQGWLVVEAIKQALTNGELQCNSAGDLIHVDHQGRTFLTAPAVFEWVSRQPGCNDETTTLRNRFKRLKLHKQLTTGQSLFEGRRAPSEPKVRGFVLENKDHLWDANPPRSEFVIHTLTT